MRKHEYVHTISTHTIMVDKIHWYGRWGNIYLCIFYFQYRGHWRPSNTRSQGISDHDTDLFIPDSLFMLGVNVCIMITESTHIHIWLCRTIEVIEAQVSLLESYIRDSWAHSIISIMKDGCSQAKNRSRVHAMCKSVTWYHCFCT